MLVQHCSIALPVRIDKSETSSVETILLKLLSMLYKFYWNSEIRVDLTVGHKCDITNRDVRFAIVKMSDGFRNRRIFEKERQHPSCRNSSREGIELYMRHNSTTSIEVLVEAQAKILPAIKP